MLGFRLKSAQIALNSLSPLDDSQDNLGFEFYGVFFLWHDNDLLFDLIMPQIRV